MKSKLIALGAMAAVWSVARVRAETGVPAPESRAGNYAQPAGVASAPATEWNHAGVSLPSLDGDARLSDYLAYAALNNPGLEAAFNRWKAAVERIPQAKALSNPQFSYTYMFQDVETRVGPQKDRYSLSQAFPWFGTLGLREAVADESAKAAYEAFQAARLGLFYQVKDAFYEYYYLARAIAITEENLQLLKRFESVAQAQYKAGAPVAEVIKAQVELGKLDDRLRSLKDMREPMVARLNAALNRRHDRTLPWPQTAPRHDATVPNEEIFKVLQASNPELKSLDHAVAREEGAIRLARTAYFPSLMVGVDYIFVDDALNPGTPDSGMDAIMAMVALELPIWRGKNRAGVEEARRNRDAAVLTREETGNQVESRLKMVLYEFRDAERKINLYGSTLIPQAEQGLNVTEEAYRGGEVDFLSLIDAERLLLEFQLAHERALADREQRLAEVEMLVGMPLDTHDMTEEGP
jgi:outer membrane protein TolC